MYYCCLEAIQNVAKPAGRDAHASIRLYAAPDALHLDVRDDAPGFDTTRGHDGVGLQTCATASARSAAGSKHLQPRSRHAHLRRRPARQNSRGQHTKPTAHNPDPESFGPEAAAAPSPLGGARSVATPGR